MPTTRLRIGEALAHLRKQRGLSQRQLAARRKVIPQSISKVETQNPTVRTIEEYLSALEATPEDFIQALATVHRAAEPRISTGRDRGTQHEAMANEAFDRMMDAMQEFRRVVQGDWNGARENGE